MQLRGINKSEFVSNSEALSPSPDALTPTIIQRSEHGISRANISDNALKVLYRLKDAGYAGYLVGGGVRDLLLGREPKDFDVATDAHPEDVKALFRNCRLVGRRFRLAHVFFGRETIEVATFRATLDAGESEERDDIQSEDEEGEVDAGERLIEDGRILRDNVYGTIDQDAWRRDFTINALYYNISDFSLVDYAGGLEDLRHGVLRLIGDPLARYREDPVRMLRAVRFAAKLGFRIDPQAEAPLPELGHLLREISSARLFDEVLKLFHGGASLQTFELLRHYRLFEHLFPLTEQALAHEEGGFPVTFVANALRNTDERINSGKSVTPAFLFAALLWEPVRERAAQYQASEGMPVLPALQLAGADVIAEQAAHTAIPKRFSIPVREIWALQPRFEQRAGKRVLRLLSHPRFRAAYDFFCLRARSGEALVEECEWWTRLQEASPEEQLRMVEGQGRPAGTGRRKRRRRKPQGAPRDNGSGGNA